ncbi:hypothetical protein [Thalassococcus profundi]|nr:hypothetical protein [Thalassococcus profundi]
MQTLTSGYRSLSLLVNLNWDRLLYICTIIFALFFGAFLGSLWVG